MLTSLSLADTACPRGYARMKGVTCEGKVLQGRKTAFLGNVIAVLLPL